MDLIYKLVRSYTLRHKRLRIETLSKGSEKSLLDFGCGTGHFLHHCRSHGWHVSGVEPNEDARKLAGMKGAIHIEETLAGVKDKFSVISAWHVIEHLPDPVGSLRELRSKLHDGGRLVIAVPNYLSFDAKYYGKFWAGYDVPRHLSHFNQASVRLLADKCKLKIKEIAPMKFDSYYVSILSEKYQGNSTAFLKGLQIGRKSNASAKLNGEYSSLIYIMTK